MTVSNRPHVAWRLVCTSWPAEHHRQHSYPVSTRNSKDDASRQALIDDRNTDPVMVHHPECLPWRIESRYVAEWTDDHDHTELLADTDDHPVRRRPSPQGVLL